MLVALTVSRRSGVSIPDLKKIYKSRMEKNILLKILYKCIITDTSAICIETLNKTDFEQNRRHRLRLPYYGDPNTNSVVLCYLYKLTSLKFVTLLGPWSPSLKALSAIETLI